MKSEASPQFVTAECDMRLAIPRRVREQPYSVPCAISGAAPLPATRMMRVRLVDALLFWLAGFCATVSHSDRVVKKNGEGD